jgi:hypothetical protein
VFQVAEGRSSAWKETLLWNRFVVSDDMAHEHVNASAPALQELEDGLAFRRDRGWASDVGNADYEKWARQNPNGNFTLKWWQQYQLPRLSAWRAIRPYGAADLTPRFLQSAKALSAAWQVACAPYLDRDITSVTWQDIKAFPDEVGKIKPTHAPSPVFTSKFCHFLLPRVFPVVDREAVGGGWRTYRAYFEYVQYVWNTTDGSTQADLVAALTEATRSKQLYSGYPVVNRIVELRLIGRSHPALR